jgi:hypothetical protein
MRSVGLDLGSKTIAFCEVANGKVVARAMVPRLQELVDVLGPGTEPAVVAIEACREAWAIHDPSSDAPGPRKKRRFFLAPTSDSESTYDHLIVGRIHRFPTDQVLLHAVALRDSLIGQGVHALRLVAREEA